MTIFTIFVFYGTLIAALITNWIWVFKILVSGIALTPNIFILAILSIFPWFAIIHGILIWFNGWTFL